GGLQPPRPPLREGLRLGAADDAQLQGRHQFPHARVVDGHDRQRAAVPRLRMHDRAGAVQGSARRPGAGGAPQRRTEGPAPEGTRAGAGGGARRATGCNAMTLDINTVITQQAGYDSLQKLQSGDSDVVLSEFNRLAQAKGLGQLTMEEVVDRLGDIQARARE